MARGEWGAALEALDRDGIGSTDAEALELRAQAAYGAGDLEGAVGAWEDLHARQAAAGDRLAAAQAAAMVAMYLMMDTGLMAPVRAWLRRADQLLVGHDETSAHAMTAMVRTYERFMSGDMDGAGSNARVAIEVGTRTDVQPAVVIGSVAEARLRIFAGDVEGGLERLDDIAVLLMSGAVDPLTTGMAMCELICAMQGLARYDRAAEWTQAMERWRHGTAFGGINGRCRVHRAEMLRLSGPCDQAEEEALAACEELRPWMRREFGWPLAELGNIRLRKGDLAGAEDAFIAAMGNAWTPHPGLALVRLHQGDPEAAAALIADALENPFEVPSKERPPFGDLCRAPLLDAQSEIAASIGDGETARAAADELTAIAGVFTSPALRAAAALAQGRAHLAGGDPAAAVAPCEEAVATWTDVGAPFESAVALTVLADARHRAGDEDAADTAWRAAAAAFEQFGAVRWAERARSALHRGPERATAPARAITGRFSCDGDTRTIAFDGRTVQLHDLKGLRYLARLLADPGRELHVLDLVQVEEGVLPTPAAGPDPELAATGRGDAGALLDDAARSAYRRRLAEVDDDIEEATRTNDIGRLARAQHDRDFLIAELRRAVGLGGRARRAGDPTERARTSVARTLRYALDRIDDHHPTLAAHLRQALRTGTYCVYQPDPSLRVTWDTGPGPAASAAAAR